MMTAKGPAVPGLQGRERECAVLRELLADAVARNGRVLVLRGEAGVGKSALLDYVAEQAGLDPKPFGVARVAGVQADIELAYAGLQQLCVPLLHRLDELPEPQRAALEVAFGLGVGPTPDRFLVGLAVLSLMAAAADDRPLLCIVDDAQWLDEVSLQTLGFVARRLLAEPVAIVFGVRDDDSGDAGLLAGLPELEVAGLSESDARDLLDSVVFGRLDPYVRDRVVAETRGIPLALLEVPRNVSASELAGGFRTADLRPSAGQVEEGFIRRIQSLPDTTRRLLLAAAAEPVGDAALFVRAVSHLGLPIDDLVAAEAANLIEFGPHVRFPHPLMRSAAYRAAELSDRREIHRALAAATDPDQDPDRRAWHAANGAVGPDDAVAADLEASAGRAQLRGGVAAAAHFLERAVTLTADPALRARRAIAAAQAKRDAAAPEAAYELLGIAELGPLPDLHRAQAARLRAQIDFLRSRGGEPGAPPLSFVARQLVAAGDRFAELDEELARETYLEALAAAMYAGRLGAPGLLDEAVSAARAALDRVEVLQRPIDFLLSGMVSRIADGVHAGTEHLRTALEMMCTDDHQRDGQALRWMSLGLAIVQESAAGELWDETIYRRLATAAVRHAREAGALAVLPPALTFRAGVHVLAGEFATAATLIEEAATITAATGYAPTRYQALNAAAWLGSASDAVRLIDAAEADGSVRGEGRVLGLAGYLTAVLNNGLGRYAEAFAAAHRGSEYEDLGFHSWCLFELIESAVHLGRPEDATHAIERLRERAGASGTDWGLGAVANAQALLADNEEADRLFAEAIERLERTDVALHLARARLSYGEQLRRMNRRTDARRQLTGAYEMFTAMGATAFAERARRELIAAGEKVRRQPLSSGDELTAQEAQIARLAADGHTNQEIGAQLFISVHTVEWHLRKVFVKLDITSRRQLRTVSWAS